MELIKNLEHGRVYELKNIVDYEDEAVTSLTLAQTKGTGITLFAFEKGEGVSTHAAPGDAMVVIIEGIAEIVIDGVKNEVSKGQTIVMPAGIPHSVKAIERLKMLLTVVK